jgi:hypothetical protein
MDRRPTHYQHIPHGAGLSYLLCEVEKAFPTSNGFKTREPAQVDCKRCRRPLTQIAFSIGLLVDLIREAQEAK